MQALSSGPSTPIEQVTELGDGIIQKLVAAGITTVESLADMTPEQLEEIPGIGEKTLERIGVAVRHYFGHFEEGEEGYVPEEPGEPLPGQAEVENAPAVVANVEAETENSAEVLEEAEGVAAVAAGVEPLTTMEDVVENVPDADVTLGSESGELESENENKQAAKEGDA